MPCPHFEVSIVKRSDDKSAVASPAYQSGMNLFSEYQQRWKRYADKPGVLHAEIMLPENAPDAYRDRSTLWNSVEKAETQWNAQLARRVIMALPIEVPREQYPDMVREYCQKYFVNEGMCCDFAIHDEDKEPQCQYDPYSADRSSLSATCGANLKKDRMGVWEIPILSS